MTELNIFTCNKCNKTSYIIKALGARIIFNNYNHSLLLCQDCYKSLKKGCVISIGIKTLYEGKL